MKDSDYGLIQVHMLIGCPHLSVYRNACGVGKFVNFHRKLIPSISSVKLYALFLNDSNPEDIKDKATSLFNMKVGWLSKTGL